jgi:hypothetical protein
LNGDVELCGRAAHSAVTQSSVSAGEPSARIEKALSLAAEAIILDLEDAVAITEKKK